MFGIDDAIIGAVLPSVIGGAASLFAGHQASQGAAEQQATSARMAKEQMDFQERMSDTAEQRKVADLKKAGLNIGMAYGNPAASVPSGAMGQAQNIKGAGAQAVPQAVNTALSVMQAKAGLAVAKSQVDANTAAAQNQFWQGQRQAREIGVLFPSSKDGNAPGLFESSQKLQLDQMRAALGLTGAQARATSAKATLDELEAPEARLKARGFESINKLAFPMFNSADAVGKALRSFRGEP